jgi:hypothetical protein
MASPYFAGNYYRKSPVPNPEGVAGSNPERTFLLIPTNRNPNIRNSPLKRGSPFRQSKRLMEPTKEQVLAVGCPTCDVSPGGICELTTGQPRRESHGNRRLVASDRYFPDSSETGQPRWE